MTLPVSSFGKAVSNVLANAVAYTEAGKTVAVFMDGREFLIHGMQPAESPLLPVPFH